MDPQTADPAPARMPLPLALVKALRPKQWIKNLLVYAAVIFSLRFTETEPVLRATVAFAAFCLVSSAGYLFNDSLDVDADRKHPTKRLRPIASGALPVPVAYAEMAACLLVGAGLAWWLSPAFLLVLALYFATTLSYTFVFKHHVILDVMFISAGFLWRAAGGAVAIGVVLSPWLLTCTLFLTLFLGFNKRRGELALLAGRAGEHRKNLQTYSENLLLEFQAVTTSGTIISYALYCVSGSPSDWLILTLPIVLYTVFRYIYLVNDRGEGGEPSDTLFRDRPLLVGVALYGLVVPLILLLAPRTH
jgi:4-hydroxybenzoate polyprenyltransferase